MWMAGKSYTYGYPIDVESLRTPHAHLGKLIPTWDTSSSSLCLGDNKFLGVWGVNYIFPNKSFVGVHLYTRMCPYLETVSLQTEWIQIELSWGWILSITDTLGKDRATTQQYKDSRTRMMMEAQTGAHSWKSRKPKLPAEDGRRRNLSWRSGRRHSLWKPWSWTSNF